MAKIVLTGVHTGKTGNIQGYKFEKGVYQHRFKSGDEIATTEEVDDSIVKDIAAYLRHWGGYILGSPEYKAAVKTWDENPDNPKNKTKKDEDK